MNGACHCGPDKEENYTVLNEKNCGSVLQLVRSGEGWISLWFMRSFSPKLLGVERSLIKE